MQAVLALDQGTTSSRAILYNHSGDILGVSQKEFQQIFPKSGWVEHNPIEIWDSQLAVAKQVLQECKLQASDIAAIGITNQRETTILWDRRTGQPIYNAIVWQDRRTADYCDELKHSGQAVWITERTGLVVDPYFSATKLRWILDHVPEARFNPRPGAQNRYEQRQSHDAYESIEPRLGLGLAQAVRYPRIGATSDMPI